MQQPIRRLPADGLAPVMERPSSTPRTLDENVRVIKAWEEAALHGRSRAQRFSEWATYTVGRGPVMVGHLVWFLGWAAVNVGAVPWIPPFDPFPFPRLTMMVSLEAIVLTLFVLSSQNRLATHADKRAHLDLQVNLLAEREMTAVLQLLQDIAAHLGVAHDASSRRIDELARETDVHELTSKLDDELPSGEQ